MNMSLKHLPGIIVFIIAFICYGKTGAQTPVELHITHKLGGGTFGFNQQVKNNLDNDFNIRRLEYFISGISIKHDGGTITTIPSHYIRVNAGKDVTDALGNYNITNVESISFHIGVDASVNHADPTKHPTGHPLALGGASMHWGWSAGYIFIAMEGASGPTMSSFISIHSMGDALYMETTVPVTGKIRSGKLVIAVEGDYLMALKDIDVSKGVAAHGSDTTETRMAENFRDHVFSEGHPVSVEHAISNDNSIKLYPNPTTGNNTFISFGNAASTATIYIKDVTGKNIGQYTKPGGHNTMLLQLPQAGLYLIEVQYADGSRAASKLTVY